MSILLARQGNDLKVDMDGLIILVRGRYILSSLGFTKKRPTPLPDIDTLLSASKNLDDGEKTVLKVTNQIDLEDNIDKAISETMNEISKEQKRKWLNESIAKSLPR
ncbi:hypothetical protein [Halomonas sp.]|uniref:hypothetical protein n=1 Tax=Halomonas sp. TaxID=1486246 RepID=UPI00298E263B|nr:hypothetical protein [Halomonas sp.]MDW7748259.1 hypothetical protein [Halomonas sp.]